MASYPDDMTTPNKCYYVLTDASTTYKGSANSAKAEACNKLLSASDLISLILLGKKDLLSAIGRYYTMINCKYNDGVTLLMSAAFESRVAIVNHLLLYGANPNAVDDDGQTALMGAAYNGREDIVRSLLSYEADKDMIDSPLCTHQTKNTYRWS